MAFLRSTRDPSGSHEPRKWLPIKWSQLIKWAKLNRRSQLIMWSQPSKWSQLTKWSQLIKWLATAHQVCHIDLKLFSGTVNFCWSPPPSGLVFTGTPIPTVAAHDQNRRCPKTASFPNG